MTEFDHYLSLLNAELSKPKDAQNPVTICDLASEVVFLRREEIALGINDGLIMSPIKTGHLIRFEFDYLGNYYIDLKNYNLQ